MDGRRTRSTRSKASQDSQELSAPTRTTRKTRKQTTDEEQESHEELNESSELLEGGGDFENQLELPQTIEDNGSSNYAFDDTNQTADNEKETFIADLAEEENANSLPSACGELNSMQDLNSNNQDENSAGIQDSLDGEDSKMTDDKSEIVDTIAQSEDIKMKDDQATDLDAENISEDELPQAEKPKVKDAEEVSEDELPQPEKPQVKDAEMVSDEELPQTAPIKKDGKRKLEDYDPSDPTTNEENDSGEKKIKREDEESSEKKYRLPDLEKYWKAVKNDSEDFNAWTILLQYVDSENDVEAARHAYDSFLSRYCYCYGYWRKYADYEKRKGSLEKCDEVFERGLKAIPLSVDLWIHYLTYVKQKHQDNRDYVRSQFERALNACGLEFRSDKLWEGYIKWENEEKNLLKIIEIYDRLLATPTQGYKSHWENFRELVNNNPVQKLIPIEDFKKFRDEVRKDSNEKGDDEIPPGEDEDDDHVRSEEEADAIRKMIISKRKKINKANVEMINKRWSYEEGIKRPYFHVKQLEKIQLKNWKEYLDFEIEQGDKKRILVLFERCLIACALYDEFWIKLIRYLESHSDDSEYESRLRDVYERACTIHHPDKINLHVMWAAFEEAQGYADKAASILDNIDKKHPHLLQIAYRRINLERRRGDLIAAAQLYKQYYSNAKNKNIASTIAIKYARFMNKIRHDFDKAVEILKNAVEKDPSNTRLALQYVDLVLQRQNVDEKEILGILDKFIQQDGLDLDQKLLFAQRKVEFLEDFGSSVKELQEAQKNLQVALEKSKENKKKQSEHESSSSKSKSKDLSSNGANTTTYSSSAYNYQGYSNPAYSTGQWGGNYNYDYSQYYNQSYGNYQHGY
ncbi:hypothetical protein PVAND_001799 [Polypedilum vanderplanki]|uniref:Pre-mRNA-processing factor 39 n=1 Tax=Polypedilum vanderplanki TaxID=319348 RepID=A0A9J6BQD5_POLVA|nr:hypothetical protein PVAND_001799 [Polypedilum vanderplanki]